MIKNKALGLIETYGYIAAIEGLDVALKSADVSLVGCEFVKGGIVTIEITGDVSAVQAAIDAAAAAVDDLGNLITTHVIARADNEVWSMLQSKNKTKEKFIETKKETIKILAKDKIVVKDTKDKIVEIEDTKEKDLKEADIIQQGELIEKKTKEELQNMKVQELRTLARKIEVTSLTKKQIKFSKKEQLIHAILEHWKRR